MTDTLIVFKSNSDVDELAATFREEIQQCQTALSNGVRHAMAAGDALIAAQPKVRERGIPWKKWLRENCFVAVSTAELFMQMARHRDRIEEELQHGIDLSIRAARRLISRPSAKRKRPEKMETLAEHWHRVSHDTRTTFLDAIGVDRILEVMSAEFGRDLRSRVPVPKGKPTSDTKKSKRRTLSLTKTTDAEGRTIFA
jgi:hypothetical protein